MILRCTLPRAPWAGLLAPMAASALLLLLLWPGAPPLPAQGPGKDTGKSSEVHSFTLTYAKATDVVSLVKELMGNPRDGGLAVAADVASNTVVVAGPAAEVSKIKDLIQRLEMVSKDVDNFGQAQQIWVIPLKNIEPDQTVVDALKLVVKGGRGDFAVDPVGNRVLLSTSAQTYKTAQMLLETLDQPGRFSSKNMAVGVRVVWLASGLARDDTTAPPDDMKELLPGLAKIGIDRPRLVAQTLTAATGNAEFQTKGSAKLDVPCQFSVMGRFTDKEMRTLEIAIQVTGEAAGKGQNEICKIRTDITAPPGHFVVLGATPSNTVTNVFAIQILRRDMQPKGKK
jgi:hypothetical protein